ncbi:MAG TPA: SDR family oxidoreductase [Cyclobacteriaceae bacterium]|jgi:3-oxoacyl-[acyl-carrier protein] reductase|nr:SDR family oxidoreductase [Cyclobacteriaceae bacterium]
MDLSLRGKRALVCGSTQGIGKASAIELAQLGASVTMLARDEAKLKTTLAELPTNQGQKHDYIVADFGFPEQVKAAIEKLVSNNDVHILVNNTGGPPAGQAIDAKTEDFLTAINAHLICSQILVQACVPSMKKNKYGRIINIISTSVKIPIKGLGVSNTVRGAMASWSKTLSLELAPFAITVNNVLPGSTKTGRIESIIQTRSLKSGRSAEAVAQEMIDEIPAGRMAEASEVAAVVAFLASPAAGYVNGVNLPVDGGRTGSL